MEELWEQFRPHFGALHAIDTPDPRATVFYELMSGGLVWSDEQVGDSATDLIALLRTFFSFRTKIMLGELTTEHEVWVRFRQSFPHWIGLLPNRCTPSPQLLSIYRRGNTSLRWCLRREERRAPLITEAKNLNRPGIMSAYSRAPRPVPQYPPVSDV
ncbi:hypothetical protein NA78x_000953 [Anatilimnocola sp. NA78]|uniref:hypothetical protein n=1 Tax=Anatilimnocola sp. NA78 TaxID=3415683 RepID=UPI003CE5104B